MKKFQIIVFLCLIINVLNSTICSISQKPNTSICMGVSAYCSIELYILHNNEELNEILLNSNFDDKIKNGIKKMKVDLGKSVGNESKFHIQRKRTPSLKNPSFFDTNKNIQQNKNFISIKIEEEHKEINKMKNEKLKQMNL